MTNLIPFDKGEENRPGREFLVYKTYDDGLHYVDIMNESEIINLIDFNDIYNIDYKIWFLSENGPVPVHYAGWKPGCLIEIADDNGNVVLTGYGEDH